MPGTRPAGPRSRSRHGDSQHPHVRETVVMRSMPAPGYSLSLTTIPTPTGKRSARAVSSIAHRGFTHVGMDVSNDSIAVAIKLCHCRGLGSGRTS